jgi:hypothetical protein
MDSRDDRIISTWHNCLNYDFFDLHDYCDMGLEAKESKYQAAGHSPAPGMSLS